MSDNTKIGFIGFGNMAQAIADGLLSKNAAAAENIFACAANWEKLCRNTKKRGIVPVSYTHLVIPNIVAFGPIFPGDEVREHKPDEFIKIDELMQNAHILAEALYQLAK